MLEDAVRLEGKAWKHLPMAGVFIMRMHLKLHNTPHVYVYITVYAHWKSILVSLEANFELRSTHTED